MRDRNRLMLSLLVAICLAINLPRLKPSSAQSTSNPAPKISSDLRQRLQRERGESKTKVIVQFDESSAQRIDNVLAGYGANVTRRLAALKMRVVELPLNAVEALAARKEVRYISLDRPISAFGHLVTTTGTSSVRTQTTSLLGGLITTTTTFDGRGIGIAIIDSGIDSHHAAFRNEVGISRVIVSQDFTGEDRTDDPYGHGTHVASIAAGNDQVSNGAYNGIAPAANLINLRILDSGGSGATSNLLAALNWVMTYWPVYGIRVVNMSVGTPAIDSYRNDPLCQSVRAVSDAGITVIAAAGNDGKTAAGEKIYGRIHSPGNEPSAITVGASNTFGSDARDDDTITTYSSRGPSRSFWTDDNGARHYDNLLKPDLIAPGNKIVGAAAANNLLLANHPQLDAHVSSLDSQRMMYLSGSSMAAPVAAGAAALLLQANPNLTPSLIKAVLMYTAQPLVGANMLEQGAGEINVDGSVRLAKLVRTDLSQGTPVGDPLLSGFEPPAETIVAGQTFGWARGIVMNHTYGSGHDLITRYQAIYGQHFVLGDGVIETTSSQSRDPTRITDAVTLGTAVVTSNGGSIGEGPAFLDLTFLLGDGLVIGDGIIVGDGIVVGDGIIVGDGIVVGDGNLAALDGDDTACMK
jgi:subtilisin family serine protease